MYPRKFFRFPREKRGQVNLLRFGISSFLLIPEFSPFLVVKFFPFFLRAQKAISTENIFAKLFSLSFRKIAFLFCVIPFALWNCQIIFVSVFCLFFISEVMKDWSKCSSIEVLELFQSILFQKELSFAKDDNHFTVFF